VYITKVASRHGMFTVELVDVTRVDIMGRTDFWACGCSMKSFGEWREFHSEICNVRSGRDKHALIRVDRRYEWSRTRDPERLRRSHYYKNKRRWTAIHNPASPHFGDWTYWTDRTETSKDCRPRSRRREPHASLKE